MTAEWNLANGTSTVCGTGIASGTPGSTYEGIYQIEYIDEKGASTGRYELRILEAGKIFKLEWYRDGEIRCNGIGMMLGDSLIAGWSKVTTP